MVGSQGVGSGQGSPGGQAGEEQAEPPISWQARPSGQSASVAQSPEMETVVQMPEVAVPQVGSSGMQGVAASV
jgi:hypothetical protein